MSQITDGQGIEFRESGSFVSDASCFARTTRHESRLDHLIAAVSALSRELGELSATQKQRYETQTKLETDIWNLSELLATKVQTLEKTTVTHTDAKAMNRRITMLMIGISIYIVFGDYLKSPEDLIKVVLTLL